MSQNRLEQAIRKEIDRAGPLTFESFMDLSLYHPEFGYYVNERIRIGPHGDYYTSPHLHPIFSWLIANQLDEIKRIMGIPMTLQCLKSEPEGDIWRRNCKLCPKDLKLERELEIYYC